MSARDDFSGLGPDKVLEQVERAGFKPNGRLQQLNSLENRVYALDLENGEQLVTKFYRPKRWSLAQIVEEHQFLADLSASDFPVCTPLRLPNSLAACPTLAQVGDTYWAVWKRHQGRIPDEFDDTMLHSFGALLARLHGVGDSQKAPHRLILNSDTMVRAPLAFLQEGNFLPPSLRQRYQKTAQDVATAMDRALSGVPVHRIHGDCHWGNLLFQGNDLFFLDFDDFVTGPAVQDIWMIAPAIDHSGLAQRETMLQGYRSIRSFEQAWLTAVNPLKAARYIHYASWIARRFDDPSFPRAFPHFGTDEYWETETKDLEQLVKGGFEPEIMEALNQEPEEDFSKLTNKDYFYDM